MRIKDTLATFVFETDHALIIEMAERTIVE